MEKTRVKFSGLKLDKLMMNLQSAVMLAFQKAELLQAFPQHLPDRGEEDQGLETLALDLVVEEEENPL